MIYLLISILASVSVSVLLKIARQKQIGLAQAIGVNYAVATLLTAALLEPNFTNWQQTLLPHAWLFGLLGVLLPSVFVIMGKAGQHAGIVKSDAAQRLSLFLPVLAAFALGMLLGIAKPGSSPWVFLPMVLLFLLCNWMVLPLIMLQGVSPLDAIWMSLVGSLKNIVPLAGFVVVMLSLVFGVWMVAMTGFASFARDGFSSVFLLLMLIFYTALFTVFPIISYVSYRNIWTSALLK